MTGGEIPHGLAAAASNPATDQETLRQIAFHYPELRAAVAANPMAYQGLLDWLGALGDPAVNDALAQRAASERAEADRTVVIPGLAGPAASGSPSSPTGPATGEFPARGSTGASYGGETPAQGVLRSGDEGGSRSSTGMKVALTLLIVVALALTGVVIGILTGLIGGGGRGAESGQSASPSASTGSPAQSASTSASGSPSSSPSASPSATEELYPAPDGAVETRSVMAPSGNIVCDLGEDAVRCAIGEQNYGAAGFESCPEGRTVVGATRETAGLECGTTVSDSAGVLDYGASATFGTSACLSSDAGMSCWNTVTGQAFALARGGWQTGNSGHIAPESYRW